MLFNAELIRFKNMATGAVRLEFDLPETDASRVMQQITNFLKKPLKVEMNIDGATAINQLSTASNEQKAKINILYGELATKYGYALEDTKKRLKTKLLGSEDISITTLTKEQASLFIDQLEELKGVKNDK